MVNRALDLFVSQYIDLMIENNSQLLVEFDNDWVSPCITASIERLKPSDMPEWVEWTPVLQHAENTMNNIADALDLNIPQDFTTFFTRYYSLDLPAMSSRGELSLLQVWNLPDFDRLQKNLIAHVLMKRRLKQAETLFFALTDEDEFIISILCSSGEVVLEPVGKEPTEVLAPDIASFIGTLTPLAKNLTL